MQVSDPSSSLGSSTKQKLKGTKLEVLKFSAEWCYPCKMLRQAIQDAGLLEKVKEIDVESEPALAKKYGVRGLPTTIFLDDKGNEHTRIVGSNFSSIIDLLKSI